MLSKAAFLAWLEYPVGRETISYPDGSCRPPGGYVDHTKCGACGLTQLTRAGEERACADSECGANIDSLVDSLTDFPEATR